MNRCEVTTPPLRNNNEWTESQVNHLVCLYRRQSCLWKKNDSAYLDYDERRLAYETIRDEINRDVGLVEVILEIRRIRRVYVEEWRKVIEAMWTHSMYEPQVAWFDKLNDFLFDHLHVDEIENIEPMSKVGSYSSNYCEDSPSSAGHVSTSKASCCLSEAWTNSIDTIKISRRKNSCCRCLSTRFTGGADGISLKIAKQRRTKSDPIVYENESIQEKEEKEVGRRNEGSMSSTRSGLTIRKSCDQYDLFAKRIACRLKRMNPEEASKAQRDIETLLMNAELNLEIHTSGSSSIFIENKVDPNNSRTFSILPHSKSRLCESLASSLRSEAKV